MSDDTKVAIAATLIGLAFMGLVAAALFWVESIRCENRWADSGMRSEFAFFTGCRVQVEEGKWIPDDRYRELPQ